MARRPIAGRPCGEGLEADASAQFDVTRLALAQGSESAKAAGVVETEVVVGPLIVVDDVSEDALELQANAFRYPDVLLNAGVNVPVGQAIENSGAAIPGIDPQNWVAPVRILVHPSREIIRRVAVGLVGAEAGEVVARALVGMSVGNGADRHGVFHVIVAAADAIASAEGLVVAVGGTDLRRNTGAGSNDGCERPTAQYASRKSGLRFKDSRLVDQERV